MARCVMAHCWLSAQEKRQRQWFVIRSASWSVLGVRLSALHSAVPKALQMDIITNMATTMARVIMEKAMATMENMDIMAMAQSRSR